MSDVKTILDKGLNDIKLKIAESIRNNDRSATGKTIKSLQVEVKETGTEIQGTLSGRGFITTLETGRGETKRSGDGSLKDSLLEWMNARGIDESLLYPILTKLNKQGWNTTRSNRTNPKGGTKGILSDPINMGLVDLEVQLANAIFQEAQTTIDTKLNLRL